MLETKNKQIEWKFSHSNRTERKTNQNQLAVFNRNG